MSYQVLARKWRPKNFADLVGQEHVVRALSHALNHDRLHHAYLFTGTRGVGKTTISRIFAKALNCQLGVSAQPCGKCSSCLAIDSDRFADYVEMDAASNRGVDDMAALLDKAVYAPVEGRYKVYMIDEVHMLTGHAFNAMLKTLEEPPAHVKFILATTDPQKIPVTVLSRCLQFNLKQMPPSQIVEHLGKVLLAEQISFEPGALRHIARSASGSMRDALSLLDQAIAHGSGKLDEIGVTEMLGTVGDEHLHQIVSAVAMADVTQLLQIADQMAARSLSFAAALQGLASIWQRLALVQFARNGITDPHEREQMLALADGLSPEFIQLAYQICIHGRDELSLAPDEFSGFVMCLLRLVAFLPETIPTDGARQAPPRRPSSTIMPAAKPVLVQQPDLGETEKNTAELTESPENNITKTIPLINAETVLPLADVLAPILMPDAAVEPAVTNEMLSDETPLLAVVAGNMAAPAVLDNAVDNSQDVAEAIKDWPELIERLRLGGIVRELAMHSVPIRFEEDCLYLLLERANAHVSEHAHSKMKLSEALSAYFGRSLRLELSTGVVATLTPAKIAEQARSEASEAAQLAFENDSVVRGLVERFDAVLDKKSVQPVNLKYRITGDK